MAHIVYTDMSGQECTVPIGSTTPVVSIGRAVDCTIRSNRKSVSRHHAEFRFANGQFEIIDLNSSNGTYLIINEQRRPVMGREYVTHSDEVWCGDFILRFFDDEPANVYTEDRTIDGDDNVSRAPMATFDSIPPAPNNNFISEPEPPMPGPGLEPDRFGGASEPASWQQANSSSAPGWANSGPSDPLPPQQPSWANQSAPPPNPDPIQPSWHTDAPDQPQMQQPSQPSWADDHDANRSGAPWDQPNQEEGWTKPKSTHDAVVAEQVERLRAEKDSIEDMAARQRQEIERLEDLLEELRLEHENQELPEIDTSESEALVEQLNVELSEARLETERLGAELTQTKAELAQSREQGLRMDDLEREIDELRALNNNLRDEVIEAREQQADPEAEQALHDEIAARTAEVLDLQSQLSQSSNEFTKLQAELEAARAGAGDADKAQEEISHLRDEVKRKERLVVEFERRNRELQHDLSVHEEASKNLREEIDRLRDVVDSSVSNDAVQQELDESRRALDEARETIKTLSHSLESAQADTESADRIEELLTQNDALREALSHQPLLEQTVATDGPVIGVPPEVREFLEKLERIVDAIDRADLDPLSTVDRVRLQSAIRETNPKSTLARILESLE